MGGSKPITIKDWCTIGAAIGALAITGGFGIYWTFSAFSSRFKTMALLMLLPAIPPFNIYLIWLFLKIYYMFH